jgi:hypothetical protein
MLRNGREGWDDVEDRVGQLLIRQLWMHDLQGHLMLGCEARVRISKWLSSDERAVVEVCAAFQVDGKVPISVRPPALLAGSDVDRPDPLFGLQIRDTLAGLTTGQETEALVTLADSSRPQTRMPVDYSATPLRKTKVRTPGLTRPRCGSN